VRGGSGRGNREKARSTDRSRGEHSTAARRNKAATESAAARLVSPLLRLSCPSPRLCLLPRVRGHHHLTPPAPHDNRFSVPFVRDAVAVYRRGGRRRCTRSCRGPRAGCSAAAGPPPGRTRKSRAFLLFSPSRRPACAFLGFGTGIRATVFALFLVFFNYPKQFYKALKGRRDRSMLWCSIWWETTESCFAFRTRLALVWESIRVLQFASVKSSPDWGNFKLRCWRMPSSSVALFFYLKKFNPCSVLWSY
jgi:hypothetical protein